MQHLDSELPRDQISMVALEELVGKDSYARLVDLFVEALPMEKLGFEHSQQKKIDRHLAYINGKINQYNKLKSPKTSKK